MICKVYTRTLWFLQLCMDLYVFDFKKCIKLCWALLIFDVLIWVLSETQSQSIYYIEHLRFWFGFCLKHPNSNLKFVYDIGRLKFWFGFLLTPKVQSQVYDIRRHALKNLKWVLPSPMLWIWFLWIHLPQFIDMVIDQ